MVSAAERWVENQKKLAWPARVHWCDDSNGEAWRLLEIGLTVETNIDDLNETWQKRWLFKVWIPV